MLDTDELQRRRRADRAAASWWRSGGCCDDRAAHSGRPRPRPAAGAWPWLHDLARWIGTWCFRPFYRLRVHHRDRIPAAGPVVLVANHSAFVDGPLLFGLFGRRAVFLVKQEMFRGPLGWALPRIGQLAVRRGEPDPAPLTRGAGGAARRRAGRGVPGGHPRRRRGRRGAARRGLAGPRGRGGGAAGGRAGAPAVPAARGGGSGRGSTCWWGSRSRWPAGGGRAGLAAATETVRAALAGLVAELDEVRSNVT